MKQLALFVNIKVGGKSVSGWRFEGFVNPEELPEFIRTIEQENGSGSYAVFALPDDKPGESLKRVVYRARITLEREGKPVGGTVLEYTEEPSVEDVMDDFGSWLD